MRCTGGWWWSEEGVSAVILRYYPALSAKVCASNHWHGWWHVTAVAAASHCVDLANGGGGLVARAVGRLEL